MLPAYDQPVKNLSRLVCLVLVLVTAAGPLGCRNPAQSSLPPSAISPPGTPLPILAKGDVYANEVELDPEARIQPGDVLEIIIRRGASEERMTTPVHKTGWASLALADVEVHGLTSDQAAARIHEAVSPFLRNPRVKVNLKRANLKVKRIFVFGDVTKPGMYPMTRHMTVMEALTAADNYKETALLDEIRIIRGNLERPEVLTADISRLLTYGDMSRNLSLHENDVVYVPRERLGDAGEAARKIIPVLQVVLAPFQAAFFGVAVSGGL